jgi:hypothetical protein
MSVLIEGISVVIRVEAIHRLTGAGIGRFVETVPNGTFCSDGHLARVGFMHPADAEAYVASLADSGFVPTSGGLGGDVVMVDQELGLGTECGWAEVIDFHIEGDPERSVTACKLRGTQEILYAPKGWEYETSLTRNHVVLEERWLPEFVDFVRHRDGVNVYRDLRTGRILEQVHLDLRDPAATPWGILGLPDPHAGTLQDPGLAATYREFCASLEVDPEGRFVRADGYPFYHAAGAFQGGDPSWLQLICGLYHPNANQMRFIRTRFRCSMGWGDDEKPWLSQGEVEPWHSLLSLRAFEDFMQTRDYATLTASTVPGRTRGRLEGTIGGFAMASVAHLHLSRYSRDWTIVVWWAGPEPDAEGVFPTVLGFVRSDDVERNTVHLLNGMELFTLSDRGVATTGVSDLVAAGWVGDEDQPSIGPFLAQFSDRELAILRAAWGGLLSDEAYSAHAMAWECVGGEDELGTFRERYGPVRSAAYFHEIHEQVTGDVPE